MRFRRFALLCFILFSGLTLEAAYQARHNLPLDFGPLGWRVFGGEFSGPSFEFSEDLTEPLGTATTISVANSFGAVRIQRGAGKEAVVRLRKVVYKRSETEARAFADTIHIEKSRVGDALRLATNRATLGGGDSGWAVGFETNFEIEVPEGVKVKIENEHGDVDVADMAAADIANGFGSVVVSRIAGPADIRSEHGDVRLSTLGDTLKLVSRFGDVEISDVPNAVTVESEHGDMTLARLGSVEARLAHGSAGVETVTGDIAFHGEHAELDAKDVTGRVTVETGFRDVTLTRIKGEASVKNSHGDVSASQVGGALFVESGFGDVDAVDVGGAVEITVEHGNVTANRIPRGAKIKAPGGDIKLTEFGGPVELNSERGSLTLEPAAPVLAPISATTQYGEVELLVPDGSRFDLDARSESGDVHVDLRNYVGNEDADRSGDADKKRRHATGKLAGGGRVVTLLASHGDVRVNSSARTTSESN